MANALTTDPAAGSRGGHGALGAAVFLPDGHLGVAPTVLGLADALGRAGISVTVYTERTDYPDAGSLPRTVDVVQLPPPGKCLRRLANLRTPYLWRLRRIAPFLQSLLFTLRVINLRVRAGAVRRSRAANVGVNLDGAIVALLNKWLFGEPYVFLSLEMRRTPADYSWIAAVWRHLARTSLRRAGALLIQAPDRLAILSRQYGWNHDRVLFLPNSACPPPAPSRTVNMFRQMFSLPNATRIALQAGLIGDLSCSMSLARAFAEIPGWALVLHERRALDDNDKYVSRLRLANPRNLHLSLKPVAFDRLADVYQAADVGLAFYDPSVAGDEGIAAISSSGKFALSLRYGKPVVVNGLPALAGPVTKYRCGAVIEDPASGEEVRAALADIVANYDEYRRNALRCYAELFDFEKAASPVVTLMTRLATRCS